MILHLKSYPKVKNEGNIYILLELLLFQNYCRFYI